MPSAISAGGIGLFLYFLFFIRRMRLFWAQWKHALYFQPFNAAPVGGQNGAQPLVRLQRNHLALRRNTAQHIGDKTVQRL